MATNHAYGQAGPEDAMESLVGGVGSFSALSSFTGSAFVPDYPCSGSAASLLGTSQNDSGVFDMSLPELQSQHNEFTNLLQWQDNMLSSWYAGHHRAASDTEMLFFRGLLEAKEYDIKARISQLLKQDQHFRAPVDMQDHSGVYDRHFTVNAQEHHEFNGKASDMAMAQDFSHSGIDMENKACPAFPYLYGQPFTAPKAIGHWEEVQAQSHTLQNDSAFSSMTSDSFGQQNPSGRSNLSKEDLPTSPSRVQRLPEHEIIVPPEPSPQQGLLPRLTDALLGYIRMNIRSRIVKGCGPVRSHENQIGMYSCSLGCGRRFKSSCDLFRHEEIVFPQQFWFCFRCGDAQHPSEKHLFTRDDKIRKHINAFHPNAIISVSTCKIANVRTVFPKKCSLCLHHRHRNWKERCKHIILHCKKGESFPQAVKYTRRPGVKQSTTGSQDDDDDDEDGDDDNSDAEDDDNEDDRDPPDQKEGEDPGDSSTDHPHEDDDDFSRGGNNNHPPESGREANDFTNMCHWDSPEYRRYPSLISFNPIQNRIKFENSTSPTKVLPIKWSGKINAKGGTASVFKIELLCDSCFTGSSRSKIYAVKQYNADHERSFTRELDAFQILHVGEDEQTSLIRCYGTFVFKTQSGDTLYNLLLEYAECDLAEYWANVTPKSVPEDLFRSWRFMSGMANALQRMHEVRNIGKRRIRFLHMDLKPDNILCVGGEWKLADFGFARFTHMPENSNESRIQVDGGTYFYSAPELAQSSLVSPSYDIWSLGCVFLEYLVWMLGDYKVYKRSGIQRGKSPGASALNHRRPGFHDGMSVLPEIRDWYCRLRDRIPDDDSFLGPALEMVENNLLTAEPTSRFTAKETWSSLFELTKASWLTRGWIMQELLLTPRSMRSVMKEFHHYADQMDVVWQAVQNTPHRPYIRAGSPRLLPSRTMTKGEKSAASEFISDRPLRMDHSELELFQLGSCSSISSPCQDVVISLDFGTTYFGTFNGSPYALTTTSIFDRTLQNIYFGASNELNILLRLMADIHILETYARNMIFLIEPTHDARRGSSLVSGLRFRWYITSDLEGVSIPITAGLDGHTGQPSHGFYTKCTSRNLLLYARTMGHEAYCTKLSH